MNAKETGGAAFPAGAQGGMSLRDDFAAKAMQGFASSNETTWKDGIAGMAKEANAWADAMIEVRKMSNIKTWQEAKAASEIEMNIDDWMQDEIDELRTEAVAAEIRIENDKLEFQRIYAVLRSHAEITQKAEAEREAALADAKRYQWLRKTTNWVSSKGNRIDGQDSPELWDASIDAAMKGEQP